LRRQIEAKARVVESENLFQVLGLSPDAGRDDVKRAYFEAAKRFHPDRLAALGLEAMRHDVEKIFRRAGEAYGTLYDDARRTEYQLTMAKPAEDPEAHAKAVRIVEAEMAFRRGEILFRKNDLAGSIREFEAAVAGNAEEGEHLAFLAWARVCAGQKTHAEARNLLVQATRLSPRCARAYHYLGLCLKEEGDNDRALGMFRKAHDLDPRLIDAERELRLLTMRREREAQKSKGLFDRFRKPGK
jgi:tetratricopeptide (TPR) repeat protein